MAFTKFAQMGKILRCWGRRWQGRVYQRAWRPGRPAGTAIPSSKREEETMVRGTNKMVIEINDTGSPYFERVVLYVKEHTQSMGAKKQIEKAARAYLSGLQAAGRPKAAQPLKTPWLHLAAAAAGGGLLSYVLFALL